MALKISSSMKTSAEIGIVVIGRNEGQRLVNCLSSLKSRKYLVAYVDSGSTDDSESVAGRFGALVVSLEPTRPFTAARARNEGFASLMNKNPGLEFVQFVDGDCELDSAWTEVGVDFLLRNPDVALVCGRRRERFPERSIYNSLCDIEWNTDIGEAVSCGGDSLIRADAFIQVKGFRPELMAGEEPEMCARLRESGWRIWRLDAEMTRHDVNLLRFGQWWRRTVRTGYGYAEICTLPQTSRFRLYGGAVNRAIFWAAFIPTLIFLSSFAHSLIAAAIALIYPIQIARVAFRTGPRELGSWRYALFLLIAKFAELRGVMTFYWAWITSQQTRLIEYKNTLR